MQSWFIHWMKHDWQHVEGYHIQQNIWPKLCPFQPGPLLPARNSNIVYHYGLIKFSYYRSCSWNLLHMLKICHGQCVWIHSLAGCIVFCSLSFTFRFDSTHFCCLLLSFGTRSLSQSWFFRFSISLCLVELFASSRHIFTRSFLQSTLSLSS